MTLEVKCLKVPLVAIFIISSFLLPVLIAGVPIVTASPESPSKGNADAPQILSGVFPHNWSANPPVHVRGGFQPATSSPTGLSPAQIKTVYNLPSTGGSGTIAIIDAFDDPTVENDLNVFSSTFGLPQCTTANGCFEKHMMSSSIPTDIGWALEIALDTQWAHAIAPNAKILLVEANNYSGNDLLAAVDYARRRPDVVAISMSWGGGEFLGESSYDSYFTSLNGAPITFFASSGDWGAGVYWPAVSSNVVGVGGTTITLNPDGSLASETAWSGCGGGLSAFEPEPPYQVSYSVPGANGWRAVPDVSYNAAPNSGVSVYDTFGYSGWLVVYGTSAGAPQWAAIHSLGLSASNNNFYQDAKSANYPSYFRDITSGTNGVCGFYCTATTGYDYVTGLGSPLTINYNPALSGAPNITSFAPASPVNNTAGATRVFNITVNQTVNVTWYINGTLKQTNTNAPANTLVNYANTSAAAGFWNVTAIAQNVNGTASHTWLWGIAPLPPVLTSITVSPSSATVTAGGTRSFNATALNGTAPMSGVNISWTSSNTTVGTVSPLFAVTDVNGNASVTFTASRAGTAFVNATNASVAGTASITVAPGSDINGFDTGIGSYPSIMGTNNGIIMLNQNQTVHRMFTYPSPGTGGHSEYVAFYYPNGSLLAEGYWSGYQSDWHNITFNQTFTLEANVTYNYTVRTGSYPQIIHNSSITNGAGTITSAEFIDANGRRYIGWIPAIRLE